MSSPYTKDLSLEVAYKLPSNGVYKGSILSTEWSSLIAPEFWMYKFIRDFGSSLPNGADYENEYMVMDKLVLEDLYKYVASKGYIKLLAIMLGKWEAPNVLIFTATRYGKLDIIKLLLTNGANIHIQEDYVLITAVRYGYLEIVEFLLANGVDIHAREDDALLYAASSGRLEVVKLLLDNGASIHAQDDTALLNAAYNGHLEVVKLLLASGASIHAQNDQALRNASYYDKLEVVKLLLDNGADINAQEDKALIKAVKADNLEIVRFLLANGGDINAIAANKYRNKELMSIIDEYKKKSIKSNPSSKEAT